MTDIEQPEGRARGAMEPRNSLPRRLRRASQTLGVVAAGIGALAVVGWLVEWRALTSIRPDYIPMAPNTALAFVVLGLCALAAARRWGRRLARPGAVIVTLLAVLRLGEYAAGADWGVDRWVFRTPGEMLGLAPVGMMASFTAVTFLFAGAALFLLAAPVRRRLADWVAGAAAAVVTFIGLAFALGYLYGAPLLYGGMAVPMALNTAIAFVGLGAGLILLVIADDVADRRQAEEALRRAHGELEERVARRTADLAQMVGLLEREAADRKEAENALRTHVGRLKVLHDIDRSILASRLPEEIAQAALHRMRDLVPCEWGASVELFDFEARNVLTYAHYSRGARPATGARLPLETFGARDIETLRRGESCVVRDVETLPDPPPIVQALRAVGLRAYVRTPLIVRGELIGSLNLGADRPGAFSSEHADIAREVADQLAIAIQHRRVEEALRESEERLKRVVEHLPEGVCLLDRDMRLTMANPLGREYLLALSGSREGEVVSRLSGRAVEDLLAPHPNGLPHEVVLPGPSTRTFEVATRQVAEGGSGWVLLMKDVSRERELLERAQQQDRLAAIGQLAAGIAHDFNNMLTVMMGFAQMLELEPETPETLKKDLNRIFSQGQRAAQLIRQIMDFSRKSVGERQPVSLGTFLKEIMKLLERTLPENIRATVSFGRGDYLIEANPTQLQQVMTNLAVNARDAMPEGGELSVSLSNLHVAPGKRPPLPEMKHGDWVVWTVSDSGVGIPPDVLAHIYEPFFTTKEADKGTGLGLAQVYGIVKQHGGCINVQSAVGKGTTFSVYLPMSKKADPSPEQAETALPKGHGETILLVEDQADVLRIVASMLEGLNYRVLTASGGQEAQEVFDRRHSEIALVLTDVVMPGMSGVVLCQALKQRDPGVGIVAMSGYPLNETGALPQGFTGWIEKPVTLVEMARTVRDALGGP